MLSTSAHTFMFATPRKPRQDRRLQRCHGKSPANVISDVSPLSLRLRQAGVDPTSHADTCMQAETVSRCIDVHGDADTCKQTLTRASTCKHVHADANVRNGCTIHENKYENVEGKELK